MKTKLYLGSLPGNLTEIDILDYFSRLVKVKELLLIRKNVKSTVNSGYAFLTVGSEAESNKLMSTDHYFGGRKIKCEEYVEGSQLQSIKSNLQHRRIYISNIPKQISDWELEAYFSQFGTLESAYKVKVQSTKKPCSFGYITFTTEDPAQALLKRGKVNIKGYILVLNPYTKREVVPKGHKSHQHSDLRSIIHHNPVPGSSIHSDRWLPSRNNVTSHEEYNNQRTEESFGARSSFPEYELYRSSISIDNNIRNINEQEANFSHNDKLADLDYLTEQQHHTNNSLANRAQGEYPSLRMAIPSSNSGLESSTSFVPQVVCASEPHGPGKFAKPSKCFINREMLNLDGSKVRTDRYIKPTSLSYYFSHINYNHSPSNIRLKIATRHTQA